MNVTRFCKEYETKHRNSIFSSFQIISNVFNNCFNNKLYQSGLNYFTIYKQIHTRVNMNPYLLWFNICVPLHLVVFEKDLLSNFLAFFIWNIPKIEYIANISSFLGEYKCFVEFVHTRIKTIQRFNMKVLDH